MSIKRNNIGLWLGLFGGILWGVDTVLIGVILEQPILSLTFFLLPLVVTFLHDAFSSLWMLLYILISGKMSFLKTTFKNKALHFVVIAGLFGGPIGMTGYLMAIYYIGPSYTAIISATYPAIGALLSVIFLKEKLTFKMMIGLSMAIGATMLLGFSSTDPINNLMLGFFFALLCAVGWGAESVVSAYGMDNNIIPTIALYLRQTTSAVIFAVVIMPMIGGYEIVNVIINHSIIYYIALTALAGTTSYMFYYTSIHYIGPIKAMGLNISYSAWAIVISLIIGFNISFQEFILAFMIVAGSLLTTNKPSEFFKLFKVSRKEI